MHPPQGPTNPCLSPYRISCFNKRKCSHVRWFSAVSAFVLHILCFHFLLVYFQETEVMLANRMPHRDRGSCSLLLLSLDFRQYAAVKFLSASTETQISRLLCDFVFHSKQTDVICPYVIWLVRSSISLPRSLCPYDHICSLSFVIVCFSHCTAVLKVEWSLCSKPALALQEFNL